MVRCDQDAIDCFCEGDVARVVRSEVWPKIPHSSKKRCRWEHREREVEQVVDCGICLFWGQLTPVGVTPEDRGDLDPQEIWAGDRLFVESFSESPSVVPRVGERWRED
jgi:hypothetical protein